MLLEVILNAKKTDEENNLREPFIGKICSVEHFVDLLCSTPPFLHIQVHHPGRENEDGENILQFKFVVKMSSPLVSSYFLHI